MGIQAFCFHCFLERKIICNIRATVWKATYLQTTRQKYVTDHVTWLLQTALWDKLVHFQTLYKMNNTSHNREGFRSNSQKQISIQDSDFKIIIYFLDNFTWNRSGRKDQLCWSSLAFLLSDETSTEERTSSHIRFAAVSFLFYIQRFTQTLPERPYGNWQI